MRRAARVDANQAELVQAWRDMGGSVLFLHMVGQGCPDTLLGMAGEMELAEIKSAKGKLNREQREWWAAWRGRPPRIVRSVEDLVALAEELRGRGEV